MLKILSLLYILFSWTVLLAEEKQVNKSEKIWKVLVQEEKLLQNLIDGKRSHSPRLYFRMLGVQTEKLKIVAQRENRHFLAQTGKVQKANYFFKTKKLYYKTLRLGHLIIKKFPKYSKLAEVYFLMGVNSRDYGKDRKAPLYLLKAIELSDVQGKVHFESKATLADYYYNEKQYSKAIGYYEFVVKNEDHSWFPKYAYNLSWCYLKKKYYKAAIAKVKAAFFSSKKDNHIDVSDQVLDNIGLFFAFANRVQDGIKFYIDNAEKPIPYLHKMGQMLMQRGLFNLADLTFDEALEHNSDAKWKIELYLSKLDLYKEFVKINRHFKVSQVLFKLFKESTFSKEQKDVLTDKFNAFVNFLQLKVTQKLYAYKPELMQNRRRMVIEYYHMLSEVDLVNAANYIFFIGETYYALGEAPKSMPFYQQAIERSIVDKKEVKLKKQILDSMLAVLGKFKKGHPITKQYLAWTYEKYLDVFPQGEKSQKIYNKLFHVYLVQKKYKSGESLVETYHRYYPKDIAYQRGLTTSLVDRFIKYKDAEAISYWIGKLNSGFLEFKKDTIETIEKVLGRILFDENQKLVAKGELNRAIERYQELFEHPIYPQKIKARSAYNMSTLWAQLGEAGESLVWALKSMQLFQREEMKPLENDYLLMTKEYFYLQDHSNSLKLARALYQYACEEKNSKLASKSLVHINQMYLLLEEPAEAITFLETSSKCQVSKKKRVQAYKTIVDALSFPKQHSRFLDLLERLESFQIEPEELLKTVFYIYTYHDARDSSLASKAREILSEKSESKAADKFLGLVLATFQLDPLKARLKEFKSQKFDENDPFNEEKFNLWLQNRISQLTQITDETNKLLKQGYVEVNVSAYQELSLAYEYLGRTLRYFVPAGKDAAYVKSFRKNMATIGQTLFKKAAGFRWTAKQQVSQRFVYNRDNLWITSGRVIPGGVRYSYKFGGVTLDLPGGLK